MIDEVITVSLTEVAAAIRIMVEYNHVVAEGAGGAVSVAAALSGRYAQSRVCAVVSGGNLDSSMLATILGEGTLSTRPDRQPPASADAAVPAAPSRRFAPCLSRSLGSRTVASTPRAFKMRIHTTEISTSHGTPTIQEIRHVSLSSPMVINTAQSSVRPAI